MRTMMIAASMALNVLIAAPVSADEIIGSRTTLIVTEEGGVTIALHSSPYSLVEIFGTAPDDDRALQQMFFDAFELSSGGETCAPHDEVEWSDDPNIDPALHFSCDDVNEIAMKFDGEIADGKEAFHRFQIVIDGRLTLAPFPDGDKTVYIPVKLLRDRWAKS